MSVYGQKCHSISCLSLLPSSRVFVSLCRMQGDCERVQFLACDLLRRPLQPKELHVLVGMASVWPAALGRHPGAAVMERNMLVPARVEAQALTYTIEVVTVSVIGKVRRADGEKLKEHGYVSYSL